MRVCGAHGRRCVPGVKRNPAELKLSEVISQAGRYGEFTSRRAITSPTFTAYARALTAKPKAASLLASWVRMCPFRWVVVFL